MFAGLYVELRVRRAGRPLLRDRAPARHARREPRSAPGPLADLRVIDLATVVAGPGLRPLPRRLRRRRDQGRAARRRRHAPARMGWRDPRRRRHAVLEARRAAASAAIVLDLKDRRRPRRACAGWSTAPTCSSRTSGPARSSGSASRPTTCSPRNPRLVITRVTGFGQDGPYAGRPGFATLAEAMSGFAAINGEPDGGPLLPPIALTDEVTALVAAFATMVARALGRRPGRRRQPARVAVPAHGPAGLAPTR